MNKVMQTETGENGNCMSACLATVFGLSIDDVPNFYTLAGSDSKAWWDAVAKWLNSRGWDVCLINADESYLARLKGVHIVGGASPRGVQHATVWKNGSMIHDPHPDGGGISPPYDVSVIYPLDPSSFVQHPTTPEGEQSEQDGVARDAERYRWLRITDNFPGDEGDGPSLWDQLCELDANEFDDFIDKAMLSAACNQR